MYKYNNFKTKKLHKNPGYFNINMTVFSLAYFQHCMHVERVKSTALHILVDVNDEWHCLNTDYSLIPQQSVR